MAGLRVLLRCVGEAACANGLKALAGLVPLGAVLYEIAENACQRLREAQQDRQIRELVEASANADPAEVRREAAAVAAEVAADQPEPVREKLAAYLAGVPAAIRQSLRRPADPAGRSVWPTFNVRRPEDLLQLLPQRLPRFQPGDRPPGLGDWELVELLGVGGFGEVWKARHVYFDGIAPVALKFCLDPQARERLLKHEATVLNRVMREGRHPGIVPLLDAALGADPPCLKYEYIEGGDLAGLIRDWPPTAEPRWRIATGLLLGLARIVAFAHRVCPPIVHRDLKPANILLRRKSQITNHKSQGNLKSQAPTPTQTPTRTVIPGERVEVCDVGFPCDLRFDDWDFDLMVTDFGIGGAAQALQEGRPATAALGTVLRGSHTPLYASPQQTQGEPADPRDDVYSLGVIWFQMLSGDLNGGAPTGLWADDLEEQGVPRELIRLLGACVAARAERRPADAAALAEQLEKVLTPAVAAKPKPVVTPPAPEPPPAAEDRLALFLRTGKTGALSWLLDLTNRRVGDAGAVALAQSPRLANLSVLILSGCDIGDEGVRALAASPHVMNLTRLDLWDNRVGDAGVKALAECRFLEALTTLDLGRNRVGDEGVKALAASPHLRHLNELLLVSNHVGDEGALAIAASPHLANLAWLKPLDNRISARGADALKAAFGKRVRIM